MRRRFNQERITYTLEIIVKISEKREELERSLNEIKSFLVLFGLNF